MNRQELTLKDGWQFALGQMDCAPADGYADVEIPHDWASGGRVVCPENITFKEMSQGFFQRRGIGWCKKEFLLENLQENECVWLCFGGVFEKSAVWVNGQYAGGHNYGYTSFEIDVTPYIHEGANALLVRVDNTTEPADRWYSGCGIYRPVKLLRMARQHIDPRKVVVTTVIDAGCAEVTIRTGTTDTVRAELTLPNGRMVCAAGSGLVKLTVPDAPLWSAKDPQLCSLTLSLMDEETVLDAYTLRIGLRSVTFDQRGFLVNGRPEVMRGVCIHQDFAPVGVAVTPELWRERLRLLKEMGCNAIRAAHHVYASEFMDLCDEMGFYVYEECFDKWHSGLYGRYFDTDWRLDMEAMITRDRNRPSVVVWGVGNEVENQAQPSMLETLRMLVACVRQLDPTRPVTYAMNPHFKRAANIDLSKIGDVQAFVDEVDEREIEDIDERVACISRIAAEVDIIACNYQEQWYEAIHAANPDKLILGTELYQYFMGHPDNMQNYVERLPSLVPERCGYVIGGFIWTGFDYLGESMGWPSKGWTGSIFRTNHTKRFSYHILRAIWSEEPVMRVGLLDYTLPDEYTKEHWSVPPYEELWDYPQIGRLVLPVMVATNCDKVVIDYGQKELILDENNRDANGMLRGFIPYVAGQLTATGYRNGQAVCIQVIRTPGPASRLAFEEAPCARCGEKLLLTVQAQDAEGNINLRATQPVTFAVTGDAEIIGTDNGDLNCHVPYTSNEMPLYRGRVSVLIRITGPGNITIRAEGDGLQGAEYTVRVAE